MTEYRRDSTIRLTDVLARVKGIRACSGYYVARCPAHDDRQASLSIRESDRGTLLLKCFAGCSFKSIIVALHGQPWRPALGLAGASSIQTRTDRERREYARRIWRETKPATGTLVEVYLRSRGIILPIPPTLRFHPNLRHLSGIFAPAMIAAVEHLQSSCVVIALHRTWLRPDGHGKANVEPSKAALGSIRGGAARLAPVGKTLALAEGIETGLSVLQASNVSTWAALGTSNLARVELPDCVREVIIAADNDDPGRRAAQAAARRFYFEGREVRIVRPYSANDFNDRLLA